ncbi:hypothetical protein AAFF_G00135500 [Aldrovandia affinis]|uniref:Tyrosine-protein kinase ephrin type A/B receptor-like domain-containing protein n=1 Tax=Aldrovandia affinis TaxID=143900 RepID=A0AAD7W9Y3_9TELE|nr:hypothetical protein AAFF_G00135500 [Aldrovandia affinis]
MKALLSRSDRKNCRNMGRHLGTLSVLATTCFLGVVVGQTTLSPAVTNTTAGENVTATTPILFSTTPMGCSAFNTSTCEMCSPGSHYDNETLLCSCCQEPGLCMFPGACLPCERGFYQSLTGQLHCLPCSQGSYNNVTGSPVCQSCLPGSYANSTGAETCRSCSPGFSSGLNAISCDPCPQGTYCNSSRCPMCQLCPVGTESLQAAAKECTLCRPGMHKTAHQTMCQICNSGFFQIRWGQETCNICPENHYCPSPDVNPIQCPNDAFCPGGSTAPGYCMETFFRKAGETCELAPVTIALLVIGGGMALLFVVLVVLRKRRDTDGELSLSQAPLLHKDHHPSRFYGVPCDTEPVYAGW